MVNNVTISYPKKGMKIDDFDKDSKYLIKMIATEDICNAFNDYALDFYNSAHIIKSTLLEADHGDISKLDTYIFPLAFLYRHSLELKLKAIAFQTIINDGERSVFIKETFHNLLDLLKSVKKLSSTYRPKDELLWLEGYFYDISKIDKESDSFRYPFHIKLTKTFDCKRFNIERIFNEQTHIDLIKFTNKFEAAYEILDKWYTKTLEGAVKWKGLAPIFIEDGGFYYGQSVVGYAYSGADFYPYTSAYLKTANNLRQYMKEYVDLGNYSQVSGLFFPMCYLYRNCVELNLKTIWFEETGEDFQKRCKSMIDKKHSIVGMWNLISPYVMSCAEGSYDIKYIETLENYCWQLHNVDSDSSKFRYPVQRNMSPYLRVNKKFDFMHTGVFLEALNNGLESICLMLNVINEYKAEMQCEYRSEMQSNYDY